MLPFIDLMAQQARIKADLDARIQDVLAHGKYIMGPEILELEKELAAFAGTRHCVACASGTDALLIALMAKGVGPGQAIFTSPFTFIATAEVIALLGATPVFVDIDPVTYNMDPAKLDTAIQALAANDSSGTPLPRGVNFAGLKPAGIIGVDLFGIPQDYPAINDIAAKHGLFVIEDAAQSFGGSLSGKRACSLAEMAATSFFPAKPLGGYGDSGAVFTDDDGLAEILTSLRIHGMGEGQYDNVRVGINGRMDTLQAAVLLCKLSIFEEEVALRQEVAGRYTALLNERCPGLVTPEVPDGVVSAWAQYSLLAKNGDERSALQTGLKDAGIPTAIYYPKPLHMQTAFASLGYAPGDFPVAEDCAGRIFSLPMHPYLKAEEQERIAGVLAGL
jgi:dTDP-4-amino-4,6-dideoxygalactose transaminase